MKGCYYGDCFAGKGGVSRSIVKLGFPARRWEINDGPCGDLTKRRNMSVIKSDNKTGKLKGGMLAPPCSSFSIARDRTGVIRTRDRPYGVDNVSEADAQRLKIGNDTAAAAITIAMLLHKAGLPWVLENPKSSKMWWLPRMIRLSKMANVTAVTTDFCMFGKPWRKRTQLLTGNLCEEERARLCRLCHGSRGFCQRTGQKHLQLTGSSPSGQPWTAIAQPYPAALCEQLAFVLTERAREQHLAKLSKYC